MVKYRSVSVEIVFFNCSLHFSWSISSSEEKIDKAKARSSDLKCFSQLKHYYSTAHSKSFLWVGSLPRLYLLPITQQRQRRPFKAKVLARKKSEHKYKYKQFIGYPEVQRENKVYIYSLKQCLSQSSLKGSILSWISGLKFRRQHWFFMGCVVVLLMFAMALGVSLSR